MHANLYSFARPRFILSFTMALPQHLEIVLRTIPIELRLCLSDSANPEITIAIIVRTRTGFPRCICVLRCFCQKDVRKF